MLSVLWPHVLGPLRHCAACVRRVPASLRHRPVLQCWNPLRLHTGGQEGGRCWEEARPSPLSINRWVQRHEPSTFPFLTKHDAGCGSHRAPGQGEPKSPPPPHPQWLVHPCPCRPSPFWSCFPTSFLPSSPEVTSRQVPSTQPPPPDLRCSPGGCAALAVRLEPRRLLGTPGRFSAIHLHLKGNC